MTDAFRISYNNKQKDDADKKLKTYVKECPILVDDYNSDAVTLKIYTNRSLTESVMYLRENAFSINPKIEKYQVQFSNIENLNSAKKEDKQFGYAPAVIKDVTKNGISKIIFTIPVSFVGPNYYIIDDKGKEASFRINFVGGLPDEYYKYLKNEKNK